MNRKNSVHYNKYIYNANIFRNVSYYFLILHEYMVTTLPHVTHNCALIKAFNFKNNGKFFKKYIIKK